MTERRMRRGRALTVALALVTAAAAFWIVLAPQPTTAAWVRQKNVGITATAATPTPPSALTCTQSSGGLFGAIPFTWTAPSGTAPSGYTLKWTGASTGSASFTTTSGSVPPAALLGNITISVYADYGSWQSLAGTQTRTATILVAGVLWGCGP